MNWRGRLVPSIWDRVASEKWHRPHILRRGAKSEMGQSRPCGDVRCWRKADIRGSSDFSYGPWLRENELSAMIRLAICRGQS
jgi:hypothetical protein